MSKKVTEAEQKAIDEAEAAKLKAEQEETEAKAKKEADEAAADALAALGLVGSKDDNEEPKADEYAAPKSNMDMLREQQMINERINYQAAPVKGQTFVRGK